MPLLRRQDRVVVSVGLVGMLAAQERIGVQVGVERCLELGLQITTGDPAQDLPIRVGQSRVTGPAPPAAFLEQIFTDTHATIMAQPCDHLVTGPTRSFFSCMVVAVTAAEEGLTPSPSPRLSWHGPPRRARGRRAPARGRRGQGSSSWYVRPPVRERRRLVRLAARAAAVRLATPAAQDEQRPAQQPRRLLVRATWHRCSCLWATYWQTSQRASRQQRWIFEPGPIRGSGATSAGAMRRWSRARPSPLRPPTAQRRPLSGQPTILRDAFAGWSTKVGSELGPDSFEELNHDKWGDLDGHLTCWREGDNDAILLELFPAKVIVEDDELANSYRR